MSKPEGTEFNTPYPFTEEMKEGIKKADEAIIEEVADEDYDSEGNLNFTPPAPKPHVEEESKAKSVKATTPTTSGDVEEKKIKERKPVRPHPKLMGGNLSAHSKRKRRID